ncbi:MAG: nucleotidyltransferase domain-containing protein [Nanoarchaeota archaeon]
MKSQEEKKSENIPNSSPKKAMEEEIKDLRTEYRAGENPTGVNEEQKKEMEKTKAELEKLKKEILKKYPFTVSLGIIPPQFAQRFEEEEKMSEEEKAAKPIHLFMVIPEEKFKEMPKIRVEVVKIIKDMKPKIWLHIGTPVDIFNYGLDLKYDFLEGVGLAFPLHDRGFLGALRVAQIHKSLVLRKFDKYIASYVVAGSVVRGEATKTSDVDVFVVIDDTDVKRMSRLELKERLRSIIYQQVMEASEYAGVKNKLSVQVYILTEFWENVKDANPVIFTFIRDGIPLFDRGTFMPWKVLLKMGKIKPSPEAIDMFMSMGDKVSKEVKRRLLDLVLIDMYWGVLTPSQALLMLYGLPPPTPKETVKQMKEVFFEKEKMLEKKYINTIERIVGIYKGFEHGKVEEIKGVEIDQLLKETEDYLKRLKSLREQIEKRAQAKTIEQIYSDVFNLLKDIFGKKQEQQLIKEVEKELVRKGKLSESMLEILKDIVKARQQFKKGKLARHEVEHARRDAMLLLNHLIEYAQRKELAVLDRKKISVKFSKGQGDILVFGDKVFFASEGKIRRFVESNLIDATKEEFDKALSESKDSKAVKMPSKIFEVLKSELGEFEVVN